MNDILFYLGDAIIPDEHEHVLEQRMELADVDPPLYKIFAFLVLTSAAAAIILGLLAGSHDFLRGAPFISRVLIFILVVFAAFFTVVSLGRWLFEMWLATRIEHRAEAMEASLPEFLNEVSLNLKSGHDLQESVARAAEEDFGVLAEEMAKITSQVELGRSFEDAMKEFLDGYDSNVLRESFELIIISWNKGADTPQMMDRIVENIKTARNLRSKIYASISNYRIFLATVTLGIAPAMMALAYYVLDLLRGLTTEVQSISQNSVIPLTIHAVRFQDNEFIWFSVLTLAIISTTTSFIISHIRTGRGTANWKRTIFFALASIAAYVGFMVLFSGFFALFSF